MKPRLDSEVSFLAFLVAVTQLESHGIFMFCYLTQAPNKGRITELVTTGRALVQTVTYFLQIELPTLLPVSI